MTDEEIRNIFEPQTEDERRLVAAESLQLDVSEVLLEAMDREKLSRTDLAKRLGRTKGFVTQILGGSRNLTLRTVSDVAFALGCKPTIGLVDAEGRGVVPSYKMNAAWRTSVLVYRASGLDSEMTTSLQSAMKDNRAA